jgi:hypothetical protein
MKIDESIKSFLNRDACKCDCFYCRAFLAHRTGAKPDYGDFIAVFEQVAQDMIEAWHKAVEQAYNSGPTEQIDIVFSSDSYKQVKVEEEVKTRPTRKLKVG